MKRLKAFLGASIPLALGVVLLGTASQSASAACQLNSPGGQIKRVIYIIFDNVHLRRDNPDVPSDLEQMPNLLNFIQNNGIDQRQPSHPADFPYRDRHSHRADRRIWRTHGNSRCKQLRLLPA